MAGVHADVLWQESQDAVVGIWVAGLPFALLPLWQVEQVPAATLVWLKVAGSQAVVLWQVSQDAVVGIWLDGLPFAVEPLWQVEHVPGLTLA